MAAVLGMSSGAYLCVERGVAPSLEKIVGIADTLGVSMDYLVGRTDDPRWPAPDGA